MRLLAACGVLFLALSLQPARAPAQPSRRAAPEAPCTAPAGPLQAMVCADPALRAADARLRDLERAIAALTARPATMAQRAQSWQRRIEAGEPQPPGTPREPPDPDGLLADYESRLDGLREQLRQDQAMRRLEPRRCPEGRRDCPPGPAVTRSSALEGRCLGAVLRDCRVTATGLVASEDGRTRLLWQAQRGFTEADGLRAGIVLLSEMRGGWRLLGWSFEGHRVDAPRLLSPEEGTLLVHLPGRGGGSGARNTDLLYRLGAEGWSEIETESWWDSLPARLPPGLDVWQAVEYDFEEMTAQARLWRDSDANCCPTGGTARLDFRLAGPSLALTELRPDAAARTATEDCPAERASYRLHALADYTAELRQAGPGAGDASDLLLRVQGGASGRDYWFRFAAALGYGGLTLLPVAPPGPQTAEDGIVSLDIEGELVPLLQVHPLDADLVVLRSPPRSAGPAPRYLFTPNLGEALHYGLLPQQAAGGPAESMPPGLWRLAACREAQAEAVRR